MATISVSDPQTSSFHALTKILRGRALEDVVGRIRVARALLREFTVFAGHSRLSIAAVLIVAGTVLEGVGILLIVPLLQLFFGPGEQGKWVDGTPLDRLIEPLGSAAQYSILAASFALLLGLRSLVLVARDTRLAQLQWGFIEATKLGLFRRLAGAPWKDVMSIDRPRLNMALGSEMMQVGVAVNAAMQTAAAALMLTAYCAFALVLAPGLSVMTFGILAAGGLAGAIFVRRAGAFGRVALGFDLRKEESASYFLAGLKFSKAQDLQAGFVAGYAAASSAAVDTRVAFARSMAVGRQVAMLFGAIAAGAAVLLAIFATDTEPALLITFVVLLSRTVGPLSQIQQGMQYVANALPVFAELSELGSRLPGARWDKCADPAALPVASKACSISFNAVCLTHRTSESESRGGIHAVAFDIAPGEFIGLAGPTGSGKSTLLDLVAGLEKPDAGEILFDGRELSEAELSAHRGGLAYVAAEPVLFGGTVRSNLAWGSPDAGDAAMWEALAAATATELVERLGLGLDSLLFEAGANLSAGERQQIALARALLRRPSLLLLDEATSSLDAQRERLVLANLAALEPRPTILFVSHRPASIALCDRVITVFGGQVA